MSDAGTQIGFANSALIMGLAITLARKKIISLHDVAEIFEQTTLQLEESGLASTNDGKVIHGHLSDLRQALTNSLGKHMKDS